MLVSIALTIVVVAFAAVALLGHVLVLTALLSSVQDGQESRASETAAEPAKWRLGLTSR